MGGGASATKGKKLSMVLYLLEDLVLDRSEKDLKM